MPAAKLSPPPPPPPILLLALMLLLAAFPALAQERTVGVLVHTEDAYDGYALFSPTVDENVYVYLMDNDGRIIHTWTIEETTGVKEAHLLENGNVIVVATPRNEFHESLIPVNLGSQGSIREYTWDNEFVWEVEFIGAETRQHHAIDIMPNGNILAIVRDYHSLDDALAMGLDPELIDVAFKDRSHLFPDRIIEINRLTGEVVWQWDPWDHLAQDRDLALPNYGAVAEHPRRIDINYHYWFSRGGIPLPSARRVGDWMHSNSVHYHPVLDQVVLSVRHFDEFWIIDHSASAEEAAGSAGDLLYRWGNPFAYQQGDPKADRQLFRQHDVQWIEAGLPGEGNILLFNNRNKIYTDEEYSSIIELKLPLRSDGSYDWEREAKVVWSYIADGFYSRWGSGVQRLPNGNTLITEADAGRLLEVTPDGETAWEFVNPISRDGLIRQGDSTRSDTGRSLNSLFRVRKYPVDHPAFAGRDMTPGDRLVD